MDARSPRTVLLPHIPEKKNALETVTSYRPSQRYLRNFQSCFILPIAYKHLKGFFPFLGMPLWLPCIGISVCFKSCRPHLAVSPGSKMALKRRCHGVISLPCSSLMLPEQTGWTWKVGSFTPASSVELIFHHSVNGRVACNSLVFWRR